MSRKEFRTLVSLEEARKALLPFYRREAETVPLAECYGRVLAANVQSRVDVPGFDRASMDGYAVKAKDTWGADEEEPKSLKVTGIIHAGKQPSITVEPGTAAEIATGAVMPRGANAVVMVEHTDTTGDMVNIRKPVSPGENVMHTGADVMMGELVLREGTRLTPREISVLAAIGLSTVSVFRRPQVGIISTGDEIAPPGEKLAAGQIYDVNAYAVGAGVVENGGVPVYLGIVRDEPLAFRNALLAASKSVDVILTSGSTSAGASDMMFDTVSGMGQVLIHGIKIKPGKPTIVGEANHRPFIGLPGYPSSALTIFNEVAAPLIRHMAGLQSADLPRVRARMAVRTQSEGGREVLQPVGLVRTADGSLAAYPIEKGSGAVTSLLDADGYVEIGEHTHVLEEGEPVEVTLFSEKIAFPDLLIIGSHCLGIDVIAEMMAEKGFSVRSINVGSAGGLRAIRKGIADVAGIHLLDPSGVYNKPFLTGIDGDAGQRLRPAAGDHRAEGQPAAHPGHRRPGREAHREPDRRLGDADAVRPGAEEAGGGTTRAGGRADRRHRGIRRGGEDAQRGGLGHTVRQGRRRPGHPHRGRPERPRLRAAAGRRVRLRGPEPGGTSRQ